MHKQDSQTNSAGRPIYAKCAFSSYACRLDYETDRRHGGRDAIHPAQRKQDVHSCVAVHRQQGNHIEPLISRLYLLHNQMWLALYQWMAATVHEALLFHLNCVFDSQQQRCQMRGSANSFAKSKYRWRLSEGRDY